MNWFKVVAGVALGVGVVASVVAVSAVMAQSPPAPTPAPQKSGGDPGADVPPPPKPRPKPKSPLPEDAAQAKLYIRAMIQLAKADGRIDRTERKAIFAALEGITPEQHAFVLAELDRPMDLTGLVGDTPQGMEEQVYRHSLAVIDPNNRRERDYLVKLASGLGLTRAFCSSVHTELGLLQFREDDLLKGQ